MFKVYLFGVINSFVKYAIAVSAVQKIQEVKSLKTAGRGAGIRQADFYNKTLSECHSVVME